MTTLDSIKQFFELFFELPAEQRGGEQVLRVLDDDSNSQRYNTNGLLMVGGVDVLGNPPGVDDLHSHAGRWD